MKTISIITIIFNGASYIEPTLKSCSAQTYINKEYIVIDGGSTDGTIDIIEKYKTSINYLVSEKDYGLFDAMNKGIEASNGDYIIFMNGGDTFAQRDSLEQIFDKFESETSYPDFIYGDAYIQKGYSEPCILKKARHHRYAWYGMFTNHQAMIYKLEVIKRHKILYDLSFPVSADYKFTLEHINFSKNILYLNIPFCIFNLEGQSNTLKQKGLQEADQIRKEILGYSNFYRLPIRLLLYTSRFFAENLPSVYNLFRFKI